MPDSILCQGCGQLIRVKADDLGRKIRCPDCGVLSDPPRARRPSAPPEKDAAPDSAPSRERAAPSSEKAAAVPDSLRRTQDQVASPKRKLPTCPNCGEQVKMQIDAKASRRRCPACGWEGSLSSSASRPQSVQGARPNPNLREPALPVVTATADTYGVTRSIEIRCPGCQKALPPDAGVCSECGFDLNRGEKPERVYQRVERTWEAGMPFRRRLLIFLLAQTVVIPTGLAGAIVGDRVGAFLASWVPFTLLLLFILGTYDRVDLVRKKNGQTSLSKTWRLCLVQLPKTSYRLSEFEGVTVGKANDTNMTDWILFMFLLPMGIFPAVLFWYHVIRPDSFFAALTRDHGYAAETLYRGRNQAHAREIADTLHELACLPLS